MGISLANLVIILLIILVVFGAGKLPKVMGDLGKGIRKFKEGLSEDEPEDEKSIKKTEKITKIEKNKND
jgi:sec-independent protein translocase protein TatA